MNAEATVLKLYPLGENGLIVVWCTEEGIIRTAAKSARKPNSPFAGRLDLFYQCRMQWTQAKTGDLHSLTSADLHSLTSADLLSPACPSGKATSGSAQQATSRDCFSKCWSRTRPSRNSTTSCNGHTPIWKTTTPPSAPSCTLNRNSRGCTASRIPAFRRTSF
ncbi:recombination protein O N-terminal domain-containing protein [Akkermansia massiliensis]